MARTYKRKTNRGIGGKYTIENLCDAIKLVKNGTSLKSASIMYGVPVSTLVARTKGWKSRAASGMPVSIKPEGRYGGGRKPDLSDANENILADNLSIMSKWGFGLMAEEVMDIVQDFVIANNLKTRFKNGRPGRDWLRSFFSRHKLTLKKPEIQEGSRFRQQEDPFIVYGFLNLVEKHIKELNLEQKPENVYNLDESAFFSDPQQGKVVCPKGIASKRLTHGSGRDSTTVLVCVNAAGEVLPPLIVHSGKHMWSSWISDKAFPGTSYRATNNGWMDTNTFYSWFTSQFLQQVPKERRPILLLYDGHLSHISFELITAARQSDVHIIKLPPHTSHLLQPLDVSVFRGLKYEWNSQLTQWQRKNQGKKLNKAEFAELLGKIWPSISVDNVCSGFKNTGIFDKDLDFPVNLEAINKAIFLPSKLQAYEEWKKQEVQEMDEDEEVDISIISNSEISNTSGVSDSKTMISIATSPFKGESFENLLLKKVQSQSREKVKRKVIKTAECITSNEYLTMLEQEKTVKYERELKKKTKQKTSRKPNICQDNRISLEAPSTSSFHLEIFSSDTDDYDSSGAQIDDDMPEDFESEISKTEISAGCYILVAFKTKRTIKHFLGQVQSKNEGNGQGIIVKFLKYDTITKTFSWPKIDDVSIIEEEDIVLNLPCPNMDRRERLYFSQDFNNYNL